MRVKSIKLTNFKKFKDEHFEFNDDVNIFVGDNNAGKSTILEALEIVLNYSYRGRPFNSEFTPDIFNKDAVQLFLASDKSATHLPVLAIEAVTFFRCFSPGELSQVKQTNARNSAKRHMTTG